MKKYVVILSFLFSLINSSLLYSQTIGQGVPSDVEFKNFLSQANIFLLKGDTQNAFRRKTVNHSCNEENISFTTHSIKV